MRFVSKAKAFLRYPMEAWPQPKRLSLASLTVLALAFGCGANTAKPDGAESGRSESEGLPSTGTPYGSSQRPGDLPCGDEDLCTNDQFCVATRGAQCRPLPPPGESCPEGCERTEHCCNCTAFACLTAPDQECPGGPSCDCLGDSDDDGFLFGCGPARRECMETEQGVQVLCIAVAYDEDPFADADAGAAP